MSIANTTGTQLDIKGINDVLFVKLANHLTVRNHGRKKASKIKIGEISAEASPRHPESEPFAMPVVVDPFAI